LGIPEENIILEPVGRNTAPCIGLAAWRVKKRDPEAFLAILPADHLIKDVKEFEKCVTSGIKAAAETNAVVTIGIEPTRPETGYGYIHASSKEVADGVVEVNKFKEKPPIELAKEYLTAGDYYWNSGIFIWSAKKVLEDVENYLPKMFKTLGKIGELENLEEEKEKYKELYSSIDPISIDYGVIENTDRVLMVRGTFDWSDLGGYQELHRISEKSAEGNAVKGKVFTHATNDSYIRSSDERPVAVLGMENVVVIVDDNGILICDKDTSQNVKTIQDWLNKE